MGFLKPFVRKVTGMEKLKMGTYYKVEPGHHPGNIIVTEWRGFGPPEILPQGMTFVEDDREWSEDEEA